MVTPKALRKLRTCWLNTHGGVRVGRSFACLFPSSLPGCEEEEHQQPGKVWRQGTTSPWSAAAMSDPSHLWGPSGTTLGLQRSPCLLCCVSKGARTWGAQTQCQCGPRLPGAVSTGLSTETQGNK